jgi:hypothetical protein
MISPKLCSVRNHNQTERVGERSSVTFPEQIVAFLGSYNVMIIISCHPQLFFNPKFLAVLRKNYSRPYRRM